MTGLACYDVVYRSSYFSVSPLESIPSPPIAPFSHPLRPWLVVYVTMAVTNTISPNPYSPPPPDKINAIHLEEASPLEDVKFAISKDADTALALFENADQLHEALDPEEEKRLVRKIDFMIIPYLAVCYAFYYIDKTTLSYAAIFGIKVCRCSKELMDPT